MTVLSPQLWLCAAILGVEYPEGASARAEVVFPGDSGVINVIEYGAVPDDGQDDTAAIQRALDDHPSGNHIFYLPGGEYRISDTLRPARDDGVTKRNIFQGQSRNSTVLKLADNLDHDDAVIDFRSGPAQFFRNAVRDLTIDIGRGNPKASGLKFNASNQGTIADVTIRSPDGTGRIGLDLRHSDEVGPLLVRRLKVIGFEVGIWTGWQTASQTFEDIALRGQSRKGWVNEASQSVFAHRVHSVNEVPAIWNAPWELPGAGQGRFLLVDAVLQGIGEARNTAAIRNQKAMYVRDVKTPGYQSALVNSQVGFRGNGSLDGHEIDEYWANGAADSRRGGPFQLFPSPDRTLRLPIRDAPVPPLDRELSRWDGPHNHGGMPNDGVDDSQAIQRAIDSGATTLYLPRGTWTIDGAVTLRANLQRMMGTEAHISGRGKIRIDDGCGDAIVIERLQGGGVTYVHATRRTVIFRHLLGWTYQAGIDQPGDVFVEDVVGAPVVFRRQNVWARQLDIEGDIEDRPGIEAKLVNDGGRVWILGFKTEDDGTHILTRRGGRTELLGALHVGGSTRGPRFITENACFSAAMAQGGTDLVRETRQARTLRGRIGNADLYTASGAEQAEEIYVDNADRDRVEVIGPWEPVTSAPGGFVEHDFLRAKPGSTGRVVFHPEVGRAGRYEVALRWINQISSPIRYAERVSVEVFHASGMKQVTINQRRHGGRWNRIGVFQFAPQGQTKIILHAEGAGGYVQADAVRLKPVPDAGEDAVR